MDRSVQPLLLVRRKLAREGSAETQAVLPKLLKRSLLAYLAPNTVVREHEKRRGDQISFDTAKQPHEGAQTTLLTHLEASKSILSHLLRPAVD